jgi:hypothetical protein
VTVGCIIIKANPVTSWETYHAVAFPAGHFGADLIYAEYQSEDRAEGGYWSAGFELVGRENVLKELFEQGLGRHVEVWGQGLEQDFEGYIHELVLTLAPNKYTVGLENAANQMIMRSDYDGDGDIERSTTLQDAESQARFGVKEQVLAGGELSSLAVADQAVQSYLDLRAWPRPESVIGGGRGDTHLEVFCRGYIHTLGWRIYNQTVLTGTQGASAEIDDIVGDRATLSIVPPTTWDDTADMEEGNLSDFDASSGAVRAAF